MKKGLLFLLLVVSFHDIAQQSDRLGLEFRPKFGFLAAHRGVMSHLPTEHAYGAELSLFFDTKGKKNWHEACKYPSYGVTFFAGNVGNREILGTYYGSYGFISFPFVKTSKYSLSGKMGTGLGYGTKVYDPELNPKNVAMSTHFNALICVALENRFYFNNSWFTTSLDITHFSNGAYQVPNLGLNIPFLSVGFGSYLKEDSTTTTFQPATLPYKKWLFSLTAIGSVKELFPSGGKKYPVYAVNIGARKFFKPKVGMEFSFDAISKQVIKIYHPEIEKSQAEMLQLGVFAGYLLPLDRFHFVFGMGAYLKDNFKPEDPLYHRIGMRYYWNNGINAHMVLKTHFGRADYLEWGIGYTFNYRR